MDDQPKEVDVLRKYACSIGLLDEKYFNRAIARIKAEALREAAQDHRPACAEGLVQLAELIQARAEGHD